MRGLTEAEAKTVAVLLGSAAASERERLQRCGLPRSTYHAARHRAYSEGWLRDRYVPEPERFGLPWASLVVARPFADRVDELAIRLRDRPTSVLVLSSPGAVVGVSFFRSEKEAVAANARGQGWAELASSSTSVVLNLHGPTVPVYFDFEGLWAHLSNTPGTVTYPRGIGGSLAPDGSEPAISDHARWAAAELAGRPFDGVGGGSSGHLVGPLGLPFSQKRLVATGWVNHRVFLDPGRLSTYRGSAADLYVFISGTLRSGSKPESLFQALVRECLVFPFLYCVGEDRLLIGAMGATGARGPSGSPEASRRRPVMATLQESISGIELLQEPASGFQAVVDHRYDRLLPRRSAK